MDNEQKPKLNTQLLGMSEEELPRVSLEGSEVVRRQYLSHIKEAILTVRPDGVMFNNSCIAKMEDVVYIQFLVNRSEHLIIIRASSENDRDSQRWCNIKDGQRKSRKITGREFAIRVYRMMGWNRGYYYKICGTPALQAEEEPDISFASMIESIRENRPTVAAKDQFGHYDFDGFELVRAQMFSTRGKACITLDHRGVTFNKACTDKFEGHIENVEIIYNPLEMLMIVRPAKKNSEKTLEWARTKDGFTTMRHCSCRGIMGAVYDNMGWNEEYKYRVIGSSCGGGEDAMLIFYLEEPMIIAPTKEKAQPKESRLAKERNWVDDVMGADDGWDQKTVSTIDPMDYVDDGRSAKSSAIYYGSIEEAAREGRLNLEQLGKDKYDPCVICEMVKKGLSPQEGWVYLRGMAVFKKNSIMIFPEDWADSFGTDIYHSCTRKQARYEHGASGSKAEPYGWTLGVDVPTREEVDEEIEKLKKESA